MRVVTALMACSLAGISTAGCGDIDGSTAQFPGTILYVDPKGAFEFRLLQPPWIPPLFFADIEQTFSVVPPPDATVTPDPSILLREALYSLQFAGHRRPGDRDDGGEGDDSRRGTAVPTGLVETATGSTGVEMAWQEKEAVFHRDAFLAGPGTPTFRLHFTAQKEITDDKMVGQMISSFRAK